MAISALALFGMAAVAILRYRAQAIAFAGLTGLYIILQMPSYEIIFLNAQKVDKTWLLWLAFAKLLYGMSFYGFCFSEPLSCEAFHMPDWGLTDNPRVRRASRFVMLGVLAGVLAEIGRYCGEILMRYLIPSHT